MYFSLFTVICVVLGYASAYPTGAPQETCKVFTAKHKGHTAQNSEPPYEILISPASLASGETATVTIKGVGGEKFKGFFVQGRDDKNKPVGKFVAQAQAQTVDCSGPGSANAATHVNPDLKSSITLRWQAPQGYKGQVVFRAVVVKEYETFWDNLLSAPVNIA